MINAQIKFCPQCGSKIVNRECSNCSFAILRKDRAILPITEKGILEWTTEIEEHYSEVTIKNYQIVLRKIAKYLPTDKPISPALISKAFQTDTRKNRPISNDSLRIYFRPIIAYAKWYLGEEHIFITELRKYKNKVNPDDKDERDIDPQIINQAMRITSRRTRALMWFSIVTSGRLDSLCKLNIDNLRPTTIGELARQLDDKSRKELLKKYDSDQEIITVKRSDKLHGVRSKKKIETPILPKDLPTFKEFMQFREQSIKESKKEFVDDHGEYLLFNKHNNRFQSRSVSSYFSSFEEKFNIDFHFHDLRHYTITKWFLEGIDKDYIRKWSGHRSNVIDRYIRIKKARAWAEILIKL